MDGDDSEKLIRRRQQLTLYMPLIPVLAKIVFAMFRRSSSNPLTNYARVPIFKKIETTNELTNNPSFENFTHVYLGMSYAGYQLKKYTENGVVNMYETITRRLNSRSKCTLKCSRKFGRNLEEWCSLCKNWRKNLTGYLHSDGVAWERMRSWKWPDSYTNIIEVFVPTICSVNIPCLQDLYVQSYIWTNCKVFKIAPSTLNGLRDVRNAIVHTSTTSVTYTQMEKCFDVLETLLSDRGVKTHLISTDCNIILHCIRYIHVFLLPEKNKNRTNINENESQTFSNNSSKGISEKFKVHENIINCLNALVLHQQHHILSFFAGISIIICFFFSIYTLLNAVLWSGDDWRWTCLKLLVCVFVTNLIVCTPILWVARTVHRSSRSLILSQLKRGSGSSSESKTLNEKNSIHDVTSKGEWDRCCQREDVALLAYLIYRNPLPTRKQLDRICAVFSRYSMLIDLITDEICKSIKQEYSDKVRRVWAAYESDRENHIIFVTIIKEKKKHTGINFQNYDLRFRQDGKINFESKDVLLKENAQDLFPDKCDIINVQSCMKECTSELRKKHSNLTLISASLLKCKQYGTVKCKTERKTCIVLHVHIKGLIPLRESLFPTQLKGIDTDVREGCMLLNTGKGPHEKHSNVKMGCAIKVKNDSAHGTLGGFIEHPEYGLCALTCGHAMIDDTDRLKNKRLTFENELVECIHQFSKENPGGSRFGILKLTVLQEGTFEGHASLDYALIAVDKDSIPLDGYFPSAEITELNDAGFNDQLSFETGKVLELTKLEGISPKCIVVKYGSNTGLTRGLIKWFPGLFHSFPASGIEYHGQIQINNATENKACFSDKGDSGALVFRVDNNNKLTAVGLLIAGHPDSGISFATPICNICADIGVERLKLFLKPVKPETESLD